MKLKYHLTAGVYLNFIGADKPKWCYPRDYIVSVDNRYDEIRFRGPETLEGLFELKNLESFEELRKAAEENAKPPLYR